MVSTLTLTKSLSSKKDKVVWELYSQKTMLQKAATKLKEFWLGQENLLAVSYINKDTTKSACLGTIIRGLFRDNGRVWWLSINFYDNWNISYLKTSGMKSNRIVEKINKSEFEILINSLSESKEFYDKF